MYHILIVEDEEAAADALRAALARYGEERGERFDVTWATSPLAVDEQAGPFDLIFMDIDMPGMNGMEAAEELREHDHTTPLIFVTNLAAYAVHGYAVDALDFIVKPFTYGDFHLRMERAMRAMKRDEGRTITVRPREGVRIFRDRDLVFVDVREHTMMYHLADGDVFGVRGSLRAVETELGGEPFLKISSGCIINMAHVCGVRDAGVTLSTGDVVWISRANKRRCLEAITAYLGGAA